jgi:ADP-ribose pyrophosphatase YjhB (NUDIX family)
MPGRAAASRTRAAAEGPRRAAAQAHAYVAVDVVIFTVEDHALKALLVRLPDGPYAGRWAFPGGRVGVSESLEDAARRELSAKTGLRGIYLEQLRTFGAPGRDPQARVVSTAYFALVAARELIDAGSRYAAVTWLPAAQLRGLAYDHDAIARTALERLRAKLAYTNIVYGLLPSAFTLGELQDIYEVILDRRLDRRNFRKKLLAGDLLEPVGKQRRGAHRPAALYRFSTRRPMVMDML